MNDSIERNRIVPHGKILRVQSLEGKKTYLPGELVTQEELDGGDLLPAILPTIGQDLPATESDTKLVVKLPKFAVIDRFFEWYFQDDDIGARWMVILGILMLIVWAIVKFAPVPEIWRNP